MEDCVYGEIHRDAEGRQNRHNDDTHRQSLAGGIQPPGSQDEPFPERADRHGSAICP